MKRLIILTLIFLFVHLSNAQSYVQIGNGTVSTTYPVYGLWGYGWYSVIYTPGELGGAKQITKIAFECINGPKNANYQKIFMKHGTSATFASLAYEDPTNNGYTQVFDGNITFNGWTEITLSTPFDYNGTDYLIIHWENRNGVFNYQYPNFNSTSSSVNNNKGLGSDTPFPTGNGYMNPYPSSRPNVRLYYSAGANPCTPEINYPQNAAIKVSITPTLSFNLTCNTTSYDLYFGATANGMQPVATDVAVPTPGTYTWQPSSMLSPSTQYSWKVVAKNSSSSTESPVMTFTTEGVINSFPYFNGFEDNEVWTPGWYGDLSLTNWYYQPSPINWNRASELNTHSGSGAAYISMNQEGEWPLVTPRIILSDNMFIRFYWRNGNINVPKVAPYDSTFFQISTNGGQDWTTLDVFAPATMTDWTVSIHDLSAYAGNNVKFRWLHKVSSIGGNKTFFLDDIFIGQSTFTPEIVLSTANINFGNLCQGGNTYAKIVITNQGSGNLVITGVNVDAPFSSSYTGTIAPGATDTATIVFNANLSPASYSKVATFTINGDFNGSNTVMLQGTIIQPVTEIFETFETTEIDQIPNGWYKFRTNDPNELYNDVLVKTGTQYEYHSPTKVLKILNANDSVSVLAIVLPGTTNFNTHELSFWATVMDANQPIGLAVGLTRNPYNPSEIEFLDTVYLTTTLTQYSVTFPASNTKPYIVLAHNQIRKWRSIYVDDISWSNPNISTAPNPASLVYPENNQTSVDVMGGVKLQWANGGGNPTGYRLYVGTNNPPTNLINNLNVADVTNYALSRDLIGYSSTIYWKVVPYNENGEAVNCPVWSFTAMDDPTVISYPYLESFENITPTSSFDCQLGWRIVNLNEQSASWDVISNTSTVTDNAYHGQRAMHASFSFIQPMNDWLFTPPFYLTAGKTYGFSFYTKVKLYQNETSEKLEVKWGTDNTPEAMFNNPIYINENMTSQDYSRVQIEVTPSATGVYYFGFHLFSSPLQFLTYIDYVQVTQYTGVYDSHNVYTEIYPNPASDQLTIRSNEYIREVEVLNLTGQVISSKTVNNNETVINVSDLNRGLYFIKVRTERGESTTKITKN
ncbi:MAG TPA: T9SS type A sorting domain-containing protein [Salinivirgaceae bacterium]|nr:T9SS type A sorting domain-containing protein [Salinivirgaceae bacterium]